MPGIEAPPLPEWKVIFQAVARKNWFLGMKRGRLIGAVITLCIQLGICTGMYFVFADHEYGKFTMAAILPINTVIGVSTGMQPALQDIISEKESKMAVVQKIYGLRETLFWGTWIYFYSSVILIGLILIYVFFYAVAPVLLDVNFVLSFIVFSCAFYQQLLLVLFQSIFFETHRAAAIFNNFVLYALSALGAAANFVMRDIPALQYILSFVPIVNIMQAFNSVILLNYGVTCDANGCEQVGANFKTLFVDYVCIVDYSFTYNLPELWQNPETNETLAAGECPSGAGGQIFELGPVIICMILDIILLTFLVWWFGNVWQGEFGRAKPKLFCLDAKYMRSPRRTVPASTSDSGAATSGAALTISHLRKEFPGGKVAVDDLSLETKSSEIFALLGHNGAGKTTAINCITGLIPPTSGEASVNGFDTGTDLDMARQQMSICPQDNPVYEEFTVRQHMHFFGSLKGISAESIDARVSTVLGALGMTEKADAMCKALSGGQKRRLWVATALIGDSPVAFLDEPTSGMDPSSRRELWDLLLQIRDTGRCIIFTTHYLEEADILADRKAVMAGGKVQALGTSHDLKVQFGVGYRLSFELQAADVGNEKAAERLSRFVKTYVKTASLEKGETGQNKEDVPKANFILPFTESTNFPAMLEALEKGQGDLMIKDYSLAMTSLEDVFMAIGRKVEQEALAQASETPGDSYAVNVDLREVEAETEVATASERSQWRSIKAVYSIRMTPFRNSSMRTTMVVLVPCAFMFVAVQLAGWGAQEGAEFSSNSYALVLYSGVAFTVSVMSLATDLINDGKFKCKYVSTSQGLRPSAYWIGTYMAHYTSMFPTSVTFFILYLLSRPPNVPDNTIPLLTLAALLYPFGIISLTYAVSMCFTSAEVASKILPVVATMMTILPALIMWVITIPLLGLDPTMPDTLHILFSLFLPTYLLPGCLVPLVNTYSGQNLSVADTFTRECAYPLYLMPINTGCFILLLAYLEHRNYRSEPGEVGADDQSLKDDDVKAEEQRCLASNADDEAARYQGLHHTYRQPDVGALPGIFANIARKWKYTEAVRGISLGVKKGECFSLLGPNGAGKTTTLSVLTAEIRNPSKGAVSIHGLDLSRDKDLREVQDFLGVCPQIDPLWPDISGWDHLIFYGRIKGVPESKLEEVVAKLLHRLGLEPFDAKKPSSKYSGGMKRKLSVGIALIGHSRILFLDEPSAAVDAGAKRHLWKVIQMRGPNQTVVLTTHSMEEAEALSDRMAIQVKGQLRCLGTTMHVKSKYGSGYQLEIFVKSNTAAESKKAELLEFVEQKIAKNSSLLESHAGRYLFQLPGRENFALGHLFKEMEQQKLAGAMGIDDFSVSQPSLEQVFLRFAKEQQSEESEDN